MRVMDGGGESGGGGFCVFKLMYGDCMGLGLPRLYEYSPAKRRR